MTLEAEMLITAVRPAMERASRHLLRATQQLISTPARRGVRAKPGAPPRRRTGALMRSGVSGVNFVRFTAPYAAALEYGMGHPFLGPTKRREWDAILRILGGT